MDYSEEQNKIITTKDAHVVVASCAGSGKTRSLVGRLEYLLNNGYDPSKIVVITFTNAAAQEIEKRVDRPKGLFIGTIHSLANNYLLQKNVDTRHYLDDEQFDKLFDLIKAHPSCVPEVDYLLLDEGQDTTYQQFEFLLDMIQPKEWMIFADWRQSIFRWNGAAPEYILDLIERDDVKTYTLNSNYRNGNNILDFARSIIRTAGRTYEDHSVSRAIGIGKVMEVEYVPRAVVNTLRTVDNYTQWFILTRTNAQLDEMAKELRLADIPFTTFKRDGMSDDDLAKILATNSIKLLTIHTAKGLEADNVIVVGARFFNLEEKCISYVAATRARKLLIWTRMPTKPRRAKQISNWES